MAEPEIKYDPRYTFTINYNAEPAKAGDPETITFSTAPRGYCDIWMDQMLQPKKHKLNPAQYKLPKQYQAGKNYEEITAVKTILNIWLPSKSKLTINNTFDGDLSDALKAFSIIYGISQPGQNQITKDHILAFKDINNNKFGKNKTTEGRRLYKLIKRLGLKKAMFEFIRSKKQKAKKILGSKKLRFTGKLEQSSVLALKGLLKKYKFNLNKIIEKVTAGQTRHGYDPNTVILTMVNASMVYGVNPALIAAVIETESHYNPGDKSRMNAYGMMQVTSDAFEEVKRLYDISYDNYQTDIAENILCGTAYLKICIKKFPNDHDKYVASYNAGWPVIKIYKGIPDAPKYDETRDFVVKVTNAYREYM